MIEVIDLRTEMSEGFSKLISPDGLDTVAEGDCVAIGYLEDEVPVAAIVADPGDEGVGEIVSIYVTPEKRRQGYGTEILYDAVNMLYDHDNMYSVTASFSEGTEDNGLKEFFEFMEFEFEKDNSLGTYSFSVGDLASSDKIKGEIDKRVTGLKDVLSSTEKALMAKHGAIMNYRGFGEIDRDLSCVVNDPGKDPDALSCLFVGKNSKKNVLDIIWAYANENTLDFVHMLRFATVEALKKYGKDMMVSAPYVNENSKKLMEKLLGGKALPVNTVWHVTYPLDWELMGDGPELEIEEEG